MSDADLAARITRLAPETWPAIESWDYDGWVLRFARGYTKRANSITPLAPGSRPVEEKIAACEATYEARRIPAVFCLPSTADIDALDQTLAARGYRKLDKTSIRVMPLGAAPPAPESEPEIQPALTAGWLDIVAGWNGFSPAERAGFLAIAGGIRAPTAFALLRRAGAPVAAGIAVLQDDLVCFHAIITAPEARRQGFGRTLMLGLLRWAQSAGADTAYLQVVKSNAPALRLYNELGFGREIMRYHYRAPLSPAPTDTSPARPPDR